MDYLPYLPAMRAALRKSLDSNDPDRKVGASCVLESDGRYNVVASGANIILLDYTTYEEKLLVAAHAEKMAIAAAREAGWANLSKLTLVVTRCPCAGCMIDIWLSGCKRVVYLDHDQDRDTRWALSFAASKTIAAKYHIDLVRVPSSETFNFEHSELPEDRSRTG